MDPITLATMVATLIETKAIANAQEVLGMFIQAATDRGEDLPVPQTFHPIVANVA